MVHRISFVLLSLTLIISPLQAQMIEVSLGEINFGMVEIDQTDSLSLTISSTGDWEVIGGNMQIKDPDSVNFAIHIPEALEAKATIAEIYDAVLRYNEDNGEDPTSVEQLERENYIEFDERIAAQWWFTVIGSNPITQIEAVSSWEMRGEAGHVVLYGIQSDRYTGYGMDPAFAWFDIRNDEKLFWILFSPDEEREYESTLTFFVQDSASGESDSLFVVLHGNGVQAVENDPVSALPAGFCVNRVYPNPFNSEVKLSYSLTHPSEVTVRVYNTSGRLVTSLYEGLRSAGAYTVTWDGSGVQSGIYLIQVTSSGSSEAMKVILMR
ncbi:MAG: T9SS type A sorting domain-containing protein [Candidatus Hatepunaea meridiana]|nr:T9SS type A sorting domain-containing protein [Candidatus Hatepunaea meridiana]